MTILAGIYIVLGCLLTALNTDFIMALDDRRWVQISFFVFFILTGPLVILYYGTKAVFKCLTLS